MLPVRLLGQVCEVNQVVKIGLAELKVLAIPSPKDKPREFFLADESGSLFVYNRLLGLARIIL